MNSLYKQAYLTSIGFTKFITGIHYLIELLAFNHVIEPFDTESLKPVIKSKEITMVLTSKSLTQSATTYFNSRVNEALQSLIIELEKELNPKNSTTSHKEDLIHLYTLLEASEDKEEEITELEIRLNEAMNENDFVNAKEILNLIEQLKLKDKFTIQTRIDELEVIVMKQSSVKQAKANDQEQLYSLTKLIDMIADKEAAKDMRLEFRQWLVENEYIVEVKEGKSLLYEVSDKGKKSGIVTKIYSGRVYKSTAIFMEFINFKVLFESSHLKIKMGGNIK